MGARLQKFWGAWARYKIDPWVVQVLRDGYRIPFLNNRLPPLTSTPREYTSYLGSPEKYAVLQQEVEDMLRKEAIEIVCPGEPAFYNRLFLVPKPSGKWRPVLDVSRLNKFVHNTKFSMETAQTVQDSVREGDWLISLDMMDAYFHIPIHPQSRKFLRFVFNGKVFQFKALCFGLSTAPQVFTRVLAPLSKIVHLAGFRIVLYLDDWLVLAKTREEVLRARKFLLELAQELGIIINREKSHLDPSQSLVYLGIQIDTIRFWVSPAKKRIDKALCLQRILVLRTNACKILAKLTGAYVITGKVCPWCQVAHEEVSILPKESLEKRLSAQGCFSPSASKAERRSCLVARQRKVGEGSVSGAETARPLPIHRCIQEELGCDSGSDSFVRKVEREGVQGAYKQTGVKSNLLCTEGIREGSNRKGYSCVCGQYHCAFICKETGRHQVMGSVPSSGGNVSMVGGTRHYSNSQVCPRKDQCGGRHPEQRGADHPHRMDFECTGLRETVEIMGSSSSRSVCHLSNKETSRVLFSASGSQCLGSGCFSPIMGKSGRLCLPSFCHYKTGDKQTQTVKELSDNSGGPLVASEGVVSGSSQPSGRGSEGPSSKERLASTTSKQSSSPRTPHSSSNGLETILRLGRAKSLSGEVTKRVFNSRSKSTNALYQLRWSQYVKWCRKNKLSALRPSVNSICKFFIYLWEEKKFAVGTIKGFRSVLQSVLRHVDFDVSTNQDISDVIRSFIVERPIIKKESIAWNVDIVLKYLCSERFEPLSSASLRDVTRKTMFLVALALAKRVSELQALSSDVGFSDQGATVSLSLGFRAKNDNKAKALPRSFLIKSLQQLVGQEEERKLCPVRQVHICKGPRIMTGRVGISF